MALTLYYMVASCQSVLPWAYCWEEWDDACFDSSSTGQAKNGSTSSADLYFRYINLYTMRNYTTLFITSIFISDAIIAHLFVLCTYINIYRKLSEAFVTASGYS